MKIKIPGLELDNPIIPASGTFGYGYEFCEFYDINILGSFATKAITKSSRFGNQTPRIAEVEKGMLNSIGLQNPGVEKVVEQEFVKLSAVYDKKVLANISGSSIEEYLEVAKILDKEAIVGALEVNVSCPNVSEGGIAFGSDENILRELVEKLKTVTSKPIYMKLSPNVTDIVTMAKTCEQAGADGLVLINTLIGMKIDLKTRKPVLFNKKGGFSGPAIKPIAIRMIYDVYEAVSIPIIGCGGVMNASDVIEMMLAGASAVQVGTLNLIDPFGSKKIIEDLSLIKEELGINNLKEIIGGAHESNHCL